MRKTKSSRAESEKKDKVTSIRLTEEQHRKVQEKAEAKKMTVSRYLTETALHADNALTPEIMVRIQDLANNASAAVEEYAPEKVESLQRGVNELWQKLM